MARKGENIYRRKDGRWEARYIRTYVNGKARYGYCYASSYREVKEKAAALKSELLIGSFSTTEKDRKKFSDYCDEWLMLKRLSVKESTYAKYSTVITKHIRPKLGNFRVSAITPLLIDDFSRGLLYEEKLSEQTVRDILVQLKSILHYTRKNCRGMKTDIEIVYPRENKKEIRVLTAEEQKRFVEYLMTDTDSIRFGVLLTLMTGMRIGEVCALRWSDISLDEKMIRVRATMQRIRNTDESCAARTKVIISAPKSDSSVRMIPLTDHAVELCRKMRKQNPAAFILSGSPTHFIEPRMLQYYLARFTKDCGLSGVHYHTLRHSFATRCIEVDFELKSLSEILGHSSPKITLELYVHSSMELKRNNMEKLSQIGY